MKSSGAPGANPAWDPAQYLRFGEERLRPALDLIARIPHPGPRRVVDLGCGAGTALPVLAARFPGAEVTGVDGSAAMLARAAETGFRVVRADIAAWAPEAPADVIFSNAALHWLSGHETLFPRLLGQLAPGGVLAVQMPAMDAAPFRRLQYEVAARGPWAERLRGVRSAPPILAPEAYYDLLAGRAAALDLWLTEYIHVLRGGDAPSPAPHPVVQWAMGSSLRPFLDALDERSRPAFLAAYTEAVRPHYPPRADGAVLLPFRRLFLVARV
ncbi:methyltransferase domain-containing protein [Caldovatus aquaticus]|uniref:Methyltransferase domain-containing protein n=1 Tax=Caldovatus aquaticus TaxID=2865671 RepID=A0ABS7F6R7_9PROT|nr:methyltransferase domain-containing protein [Caldovatus aquaticus]MBW8271307.1 methyltransferase domain-containing protein [Caldovatus aquaticus]